MVRDRDRSRSDRLIIADAFSRQGRHADAAAILRHALSETPRDSEAWLALGNALVEHADGALTQPALLAYRRAEELAPGSAGPGYFLGLAMIRQGQLSQARGVWQATLQSASADAAGREALQERLARLDELLANPGAVPPQDD
jgi:cytochrome c-type biogenesis protein CcmH